MSRMKCQDCGASSVAEDDRPVCPRCGSTDLLVDPAAAVESSEPRPAPLDGWVRRVLDEDGEAATLLPPAGDADGGRRGD